MRLIDTHLDFNSIVMSVKAILNIILFGVIAIVLGFLLILGPGRVVISDSMAPTLRAGDVLWIRPISGPITPDRIISYNEQGKLITHRVVAIEGDALITKGDNNQEVDPWRVSTADVIGSPVLRVPYLGYLIVLLRKPVGWLVLIILPAGWIIFDEIRKIITTLRGE